MKMDLTQAKIFADQAFSSIELELGEQLKNYQFYSYQKQGFWRDANYDELKEEVLDSFIVRYDDHRQQHRLGRRIAYQIKPEEKAVYLHICYLNKDPENIDWEETMHFEEWSQAATPVDEAIAAYKLKRAMERRGQPKPKWWQFWMID